jgi:colanic acid biosynthesis glycosyl transferase WcaI
MMPTLTTVGGNTPGKAQPLSGVRLLLVGVNYWPETTGVAPYTTGMCEQLSDAGAIVTVATALPHYPMWRIADEYAHVTSVVEERNGAMIHRVRPNVPRRMSATSRGIFELSFAARIRSVVNSSRADAVLAVVPSLGGALVAAKHARRCRVPFGVIFQDLMGKCAEQSGIAGKTVGTVTSALEVRLAHSATAVAVVAQGFGDFLVSRGIAPTRIYHLPNWCHISSPRRMRAAVRRRLGWADDQIVVLHAGNMGAKQALENVVEAARLALSTRGHIKFALMGDGSKRAALESEGRGLTNLEFIPPQPDDDFPDVLAAADLLLVNERPTVRDMSLPSKLTSYFAAGRPVIGSVRDDGTTAAEIRQSGGGVIVPPGDPNALCDAVAALATDIPRMAVLAESGRRYAREYLSQTAAAERTVAFVLKLGQS